MNVFYFFIVESMENREIIENEKISNGDLVSISRDTSMDLIGDTNLQNTMATIAQIDAQSCGLPIQLFSNVSH